MACYRPEGIHLTRKKTLPWDTVRVLRLRDGAVVTRRTRTIQEGDAPFPAPGLGLIRRSDTGRVLVVDETLDGRHVDYLVTPGLHR
jgi:hypothetical protein